MCAALIIVARAVSVGSVQAAAASPLRVRAALTAVRSSVMCTAFITVPATSGLSVKVVVGTLNVAVTVRAALIVTVQVPVPVQLPPQPANVEPVDADAVRLTTVPVVNEVVHAVPQLMPVGELVTAPLPVPDLVTVSAKEGCTKVAVTVVAAFRVTTQVLVPVQPPPLQPVNREPVCGDAVRVTTVPIVNEVVHVVPQLMPAGEVVTVPMPAPGFDTVSGKDICTNVAVTVAAAFIVTVQVPAPVHPPPLQPLKVEPAAAAAVRVTIVPFAYDAEHVLPQLMPVGELVTVPLPAPALETVKVEPVGPPDRKSTRLNSSHLGI